MSIPIVDLSSPGAASLVRLACRSFGFFYITNHGVSTSLVSSTLEECRRFFDLPLEHRNAIHMKYGGKAWRGYFNLGEELTSGRKDVKEGVYFGEECLDSVSDLPLRGRNQWPSSVLLPNFRPFVSLYFESIKTLAIRVLRVIALSLGLKESYFEDTYCSNPTTLFRVFHYPNVSDSDSKSGDWGVGEHTDYGLLTILKQDDVGGLEIKLPSGEWLSAPPIDDTFIVNIGDMLQAISGGYYLSTPHRVRKMKGNNRISLPFFMDPNWDSEVAPIDLSHLGVKSFVFDEKCDAEIRWDKTSPMSFRGKYGDYLMIKVGKVFPELMDAVRTPKDGCNEEEQKCVEVKQ